jgi:hypothetical protein
VRTRFLLIALLAVAVGCGSGGGSKAGAGASSTTSTPAANADFQQYRDCLSEHGIDLPDGFGQGRRPGGTATGTRSGGPPPDPGERTPRSLPAGVDQQQFQDAQQACGSLRPQGGFGGGGRAAGSSAFQAYASCLADHGVTTTTTAGSQQQRGPGFDRDDPAFAAADQTCRALLPQGGSTTTTEVAR